MVLPLLDKVWVKEQISKHQSSAKSGLTQANQRQSVDTE